MWPILMHLYIPFILSTEKNSIGCHQIIPSFLSIMHLLSNQTYMPFTHSYLKTKTMLKLTQVIKCCLLAVKCEGAVRVASRYHIRVLNSNLNPISKYVHSFLFKNTFCKNIQAQNRAVFENIIRILLSPSLCICVSFFSSCLFCDAYSCSLQGIA